MRVFCRFCSDRPTKMVWRRNACRIGHSARPIPDVEVAVCESHADVLHDPNRPAADVQPYSIDDEARRCKCGCYSTVIGQRCAVCLEEEAHRKAHPDPSTAEY